MGVAVESLRCPRCDEPALRDDRYCEGCREPLLLRRTPAGGPIGRAVPGCVACGATEIGADGFCELCGRGQPTGRDRMEFDLGLVAGVSDRGRARARNEDSMAFACVGRPADPLAVVAVVCDGVASTERADSASQTAVDSALSVLVDSTLDGKKGADATVAACAGAFASVAELARKDSPDTAPSCTFVSAVVTSTSVTIGWVGDSRAYWISAQPRRLTTDDNLASQLMAAGMPEQEALAVRSAGALSRWIGADAENAPPNMVTFEPDGPGTVVLCSDGLWNYLPEAETVAAKAPSAPPFTVAADLTAIALELGGHDNVTVVVVPFPPVPLGSE